MLQSAFGENPSHAAAFNKYYEGNWDQPGIGGFSTDLIPNSGYAGSNNVAWDEALNRYVMIMNDTQTISYTDSPDGLTWSLPVSLGRYGTDNRSADYAVPIGSGKRSECSGKRLLRFLYEEWSQWLARSVREKIHRVLPINVAQQS